MNFVDRPAVHSTYYEDKPNTLGVLHDTETTYAITTQQSAGGWQWLIGRDGTIYRDCDEDQAAWQVAATGHTPASLALTKWRPPTLVECPDGGVSDCNYSAIGIELVSHQSYRDAGVPYTDAQYASLRVLIADIESRWGPLPWVGHGEMQTDRTDPVLFDWPRAGFGERTPAGRYFEEDDMPKLTADQQAILSKMAALSANSGSIDTWISEIGALGEQNDQLRAEVASLTSQVAHAARKATKITYDDGSSQDVAAA